MESWRKELFDAVIKYRIELKEAYNLDVIVEKEAYEKAMTYLKETEMLKR